MKPKRNDAYVEIHIKELKDALSPEQLAERWHMNPQTLANWRHMKVGPKFCKVRLPGQRARVRYRLKDVIAYERPSIKIEPFA